MSEEVTLTTAPTSKRFPTTNQAKACYMYYNSWHQCKYAKGDDDEHCTRLKSWANSMCPMEWVEKWEEQRAAGTYPGPVPGETKKEDHH